MARQVNQVQFNQLAAKVIAVAVHKGCLLLFYLRQRQKRRRRYPKRYWVRFFLKPIPIGCNQTPVKEMRENDYESSFFINTSGLLLNDLTVSFLLCARCYQKNRCIVNPLVLVKVLLSFYVSWLPMIPYRLFHLDTALVTQL